MWGTLFLTFIALIIFYCFNRGKEGTPFYTSERKIVSWIWWTILVLAVSFFWTCYHLALSKGYSGAICIFGVLGPPAQLGVLIGLLVMRDKHSRETSHRPKKHRYGGSRLERIVICRRNAVIGIFFGLGGIAAGVALVLFRFGIFHHHSDEVVLGIFVFVAGYAGVITGCWWWLKAKQWIDAIVFIGLMPLGVLFVPYVRLLYLSIPALLPTGMVFMPIVLIVVVFALPDRSGWADRKRWRIHHGNEHSQIDR